MKDEVARIMKLVQEHKLSPEDAAELIEAMNDQKETEKTVGEAAADSKASTTDFGFGRLISEIENLAKSVASGVGSSDFGGQISKAVKQGVDAIKEAGSSAAKGAGFAVFGQQSQRTVELPMTIESGQTLVMENFAGEVSVETVESDYKLVIEASLRSYSEDEAKEAAEKYCPVLEEGPSTVTLRHGEAQNLFANVKAYVPSGVAVDIKRLHGDASIKGTNATARVQTTNGDVSVDNVGGQVEISTGAGDIHVVDTTATHVSAETKSGDVEFTKVEANMNVRSSSGDVTLSQCDGRTLSIDVASGDISADLCRAVTGTINIRTFSGDVRLAIADGSDARLKASTTSGSVTVDHLTLNERVDAPRKVTGKLGSGNGSIDVSSVSGDITVELRDSSAVELQRG